MIHARDDYSRIQDPANLIGKDEPVFLIRATDKTAADVVRYWADLNREREGDNTLSDLASKQANRIEEWQAKNGCKRADFVPRTPNVVDHPPHYNASPSGVECIDVVEHLSFNVGNAIKYLWRCDHKGATIEDLKKAAWYIEREIQRRTKEGQA